MAGEGIVIGCDEGLERTRAAIRITRRMMPPMMSQGRRDRLDIYQPVLSGEVSWLLHKNAIGSVRQNFRWKEKIPFSSLTKHGRKIVLFGGHGSSFLFWSPCAG